MESSSKRRKLGHGGGSASSSGLKHEALIDFESHSSARLSTASTFILQTDELLKESKLDYAKALKDVDGHLHQIKGIVDSIPAHDPLPIFEATTKFEKKHRIVIPYPEPKPAKDAPYLLSYSKPAQCNVVGSYVSRTMVKTQSRLAVDMVVQMPQSMFQEKDYLNMRYFYRRAYYISYIAAHLQKELGDKMEFRFEHLNENQLLPILVLQPKAATEASAGDSSGKASKKASKSSGYVIRLIPCAPEDIFPKSKLTPKSNCNRLEEAAGKDGELPATPFYNSTLIAEGTFISYLRLMTHAKKECPAFQDACILGRIWLQQRGFGGDVSQGGFGHFELAIMIALLLQTGGRNGQPALSTSLSGSELFKAVIQFLSSTDLSKKPFVFGTVADANELREHAPVMHDAARGLNLLFKMTPWSANLLRSYAKSTTDLLADEATDKFEPSFIMKADSSYQNYDAMFEISVSTAPKSADRRGAVSNFSLEAYKTLKKAYGNRAQLIHFQQPHHSSWTLQEPKKAGIDIVRVGVVFEYPNMSRSMEHGPPAEEQKEAARFRQFWGEKAELRRFKDGSILECVEWSAKQPFQICEEITRYILGRHLKVGKADITSFGHGISTVIGLSHLDKEAFDSVRRAFQTFEYDIRNLDDLPLQIRQLSPVSPLARYSSIQPPLLGYHQGSIEPIDVNLYFEVSSKWPENLVAIQEAKIEFLLDFDRRLSAAHENITTYLGRENTEVGIENLAYLDIIYDSGAVFRLRLHCDMEETLLERQVKNKTLDHQVRAKSEEALSRFKWLFTTLPLHTQTIATFCTRLLPLSPTIRLVKQWFNSHKLSGHISDELIELFVLHVFLKPYPWKVPSSALMGFLRTLDFLSRWDWRDEPLIIDSAETLTSNDYSTIRKELESWRKRDPNMNHNVMMVATSHDSSGLAYTQKGPSKLIASRMTRLAKAACKLVKEHDYHLDPATLFESSLQDYDVLIHISSKAMRSIIRDAATDAGARRPSQFKNLDDRTGKVPLPMRTHPVNVLLSELRRVYEDTLIFFHGDTDESVVGAIWNPRLQRQKFRAGLPYNFLAVEDEDEDVVELNKDAVLLEIARMGGDMIKKIEVQE